MTSPGKPEPQSPSSPFAAGRARVAGAAIPGCQHVLAAGLPCQDAVKAKLEFDRVILAVSDGHGDSEYPYSDEGARTAVAVAIDVLDNLVDRLNDLPGSVDEATLESNFGDPVKRRIAFEWNRRVKNHASMVAARDSGVEFTHHVTGDWTEAVRPYGCTLLAAAFSKQGALFLKLGDGELLSVTSGEARRVFVPKPAGFGQATFSLAMRSAVEHMQLEFSRSPSELTVVTTDGVCDQYGDDPSFEDEWGTRMLERIQTSGWTATALELPRYLATVARDGDDCAAALVWFAAEDEA